MTRKIFNIFTLSALLLLMSACSSTKFVPDDKYLINKVEVVSDTHGFDVSKIEPYIRQKGNSKWFSLFKIPLKTYSMAGRDSTKWINRTLKNIGEKPMVYDTLQSSLSVYDLTNAMRNMGYMNATVGVDTKVTGRKIDVKYTLHPGEPYLMGDISYKIDDKKIAGIVNENLGGSKLRKGMVFNVNTLDEERKRITVLLQNRGYYLFHKDYIDFVADSLKGNRVIDVTMHIARYKTKSDAPYQDHPVFTIGSISYESQNRNKLNIRRKVLEDNTRLESGSLFSSENLRRTYSDLGALPAIRYTGIQFDRRPLTDTLDCTIKLGESKPNTLQFQPEGTNTAGNLGAAASLTYQNRNLFRGSELFSIEMRAAFEAITGLEGYQNEDYEEYDVVAKLTFPRFMIPFLSKEYKRKSRAISELSVSYDLQNRPEFHRRVFSTAWRYKWTDKQNSSNYKVDLIDINYVYMPWISSKFKEDYLDNVSNRNAILRYNYEDLFILKFGFGYSRVTKDHSIRLNVETAGNVLNVISRALDTNKDADGHRTMFDIAFAQYVKADVDYTKMFAIDSDNTFVLHGALGVAFPYGNAYILPFEKRYFAGGANSVRGWSVRGLGPGRYTGTDGAIDFINQTGDMKLDLNAEFRTNLFWKLGAAVFIDAGNIWTLRAYADQPGGQFKFKDFYKQIAVAYGIGLRLNFDFFILRFDMGMKAVNPAYETTREHFPILKHNLSRDFAFHFAVGMPF